MSRPKQPDLSAEKAAARLFLAQEFPCKTDFFYTLKPEELITLLAKFAHAFTAPAPQVAVAVPTEPGNGIEQE